MLILQKPVCKKWSHMLWAKTYRDPRNTSEAHKVFAFAPPHILCSLCCLGHLPPTDKLVDFFWIFSNTSICILNMSRKWLPSQLLSLCLADKQGKSVYVTQTKYNSLQIPPCSMCARYHSTNVCHRIPESVCVVAFFHVESKCWNIRLTVPHGETVIGTLTLY